MRALKKMTTSVLMGTLGVSCLSFNQVEGIPQDNMSVASFTVQPTDNFQEVVEYISHYLEVQAAQEGIFNEHIYLADNESQNSTRTLTLDVGISDNGITVAAKNPSSGRNYNTPVTAAEKAKIRYILTSLGYSSLLELGKLRSDLKKTGKEVDHIHPLRFLMTIFTDEELKASVHAIRGRAIGWIWSEFSDGVTGSLKMEASRNNLKTEFIQDFAKAVNINVNLIQPLLQQGRWTEFVNTLIDKIPRQNNPGRYNM
jgi:hypothetical protein